MWTKYRKKMLVSLKRGICLPHVRNIGLELLKHSVSQYEATWLR